MVVLRGGAFSFQRGIPVSEAGSYLRLVDSCITQLKAQGPSRACNESKEEEDIPTHERMGGNAQTSFDQEKYPSPRPINKPPPPPLDRHKYTQTQTHAHTVQSLFRFHRLESICLIPNTIRSHSRRDFGQGKHTYLARVHG